MDKYAVIKIGSSQYKVHEGDTFLVQNQNGNITSEVLLFSDGTETVIGDPVVKGVTVKLKLTGDKRGKKIVVTRFKSKSRYRKSRGYRDSLSEVLVEKIELGSTKAAAVQKEDVVKPVEDKPVKKKVSAPKKTVVKVTPVKKPAVKAKKTVKKEAK